MPNIDLDRTDHRILDLLQRDGRGRCDVKSNFVLEKIKETTALPLA